MLTHELLAESFRVSLVSGRIHHVVSHHPPLVTMKERPPAARAVRHPLDGRRLASSTVSINACRVGTSIAIAPVAKLSYDCTSTDTLVKRRDDEGPCEESAGLRPCLNTPSRVATWLAGLLAHHGAKLQAPKATVSLNGLVCRSHLANTPRVANLRADSPAPFDEQRTRGRRRAPPPLTALRVPHAKPR